MFFLFFLRDVGSNVFSSFHLCLVFQLHDHLFQRGFFLFRRVCQPQVLVLFLPSNLPLRHASVLFQGQPVQPANRKQKNNEMRRRIEKDPLFLFSFSHRICCWVATTLACSCSYFSRSTATFWSILGQKTENRKPLLVYILWENPVGKSCGKILWENPLLRGLTSFFSFANCRNNTSRALADTWKENGEWRENGERAQREREWKESTQRERMEREHTEREWKESTQRERMERDTMEGQQTTQKVHECVQCVQCVQCVPLVSTVPVLLPVGPLGVLPTVACLPPNDPAVPLPPLPSLSPSPGRSLPAPPSLPLPACVVLPVPGEQEEKSQGTRVHDMSTWQEYMAGVHGRST